MYVWPSGSAAWVSAIISTEWWLMVNGQEDTWRWGRTSQWLNIFYQKKEPKERFDSNLDFKCGVVLIFVICFPSWAVILHPHWINLRLSLCTLSLKLLEHSRRRLATATMATVMHKRTDRKQVYVNASEQLAGEFEDLLRWNYSSTELKPWGTPQVTSMLNVNFNIAL